MPRSYIDTNVWIVAAQGRVEAAARVLAVLDDPDRQSLFSDFVRLETLPKPRFNGRTEEVDALNALFAAAERLEVTLPDVAPRAIDIAAAHDLQPMDALHMSAALLHGADEFITLEQPTKPMFRVTEPKVTSLYRREES